MVALIDDRLTGFGHAIVGVTWHQALSIMYSGLVVANLIS